MWAGDELGHRLRLLLRGQWQPAPDLALQLVATSDTFVRVEAGYLNVAFDDRVDHVAAVNLALNLVP